MVRVGAALGIALLSSACSSGGEFPSRTVARDDYGASWPLVVDEAVLSCEPGGVLTLTIAGKSEQIGQVDLDAPGSEPVFTVDVVTVRGEEPDKSLFVFLDDAAALCD